MTYANDSALSAHNGRRLRFQWWATAVLLLAAGLRLWALADLPPGLAQDEVLNADVALFIRQGQHALFFREGYGHEPLFHYWSVPFQWLLGDNVLSIRLPALFLGLFLIAATMRWARRDFGALTGLVTGTGLAISWWPIIFSRIGLRPILEPLLLVTAVWFWRRRPLLAGFFLGLSVYSYTAARYAFLIPLVFALFLLVCRRWRPAGGYSWRNATLVFATSLLVALPLFLTLRVDPKLQQRVDQLAGPLQALRESDPGPVLQTTLATLGAASFTGDPRWTYTLPQRPFFDPFTSIFFYAGLLLAIWRWQQPRYALLLTWLAFAIAPSALTPDAPSTVRLVGAMPLVYLMPGLALARLYEWLTVNGNRLSAVGKRFTDDRLPLTDHRLQRAGAILLTALFSLNLFLTLRDGFVRWPVAQETRLKYQTVLQEIGRAWKQEPVARWVVADAFFEPIDADSLRRNLNRAVTPRWVQTGGAVAGAIVLPVGVADGRFYVPEYAPPHVALLNAAGIDERPLYRTAVAPSFAVYALPSAPPAPETAVNVAFDEKIMLLGFSVIEAAAKRPLRLVTYWRVLAPLPPDLAAFVHLVDDSGAIISQHDGFDAAAQFLEPGDVVVQYHVLPWSETAASGAWVLQTGLYLRGSGTRLVQREAPFDRAVLTSRLVFDGE